MKKIFNLITLFAALSVTLLTGCKKDDLIFDHEKPQFEIVDDAILLEMIMPNGTAADEQLYITGEFNGGEKYQLEKAKYSDKKWGIYLYETDFADGKTLADGFYFVSEKNGKECSAKGEAVVHTLNAAYGTRTNVWVDSWEAFFQSGDKPIEHDGYVVYVVDETGWEALAMYAWGDAEAFGGWPGMQPTGKEKVNGVEYIYFDLGEANKGLNLNLIFNNNGNGSQLGDFNFTVERNIFLKLTTDGAEEITPAEPGTVFPTIKHDGQDIVFVADNAKWGAMALYMWGDINNLDRDGGESAGWPGLTADGEFDFAGLHWYYFLMGAANEGKTENMIFNNNNGGNQTGDINVTFGAGEAHYYMVNEDKSYEVIEDPNTYKFPGQEINPDPEPGRIDTVIVTVKDTITTHLYFVDESTNMHFLYAWGTSDLFGGWPGVKWATEWQTATFLGKQFRHYSFDAEYGSEFNLIFNNKGYTELAQEEQDQYDAFTLKVGAKTELFYTIKNDKAEELKPTTEQADIIRRMFR